MSLDDFCRLLAIEPIHDWQEIDDARAIDLIQEILDSVTDLAIQSRNIEALERRYRKPSGYVNGLLFEEEMTESGDVLNALKRDTVIYL